MINFTTHPSLPTGIRTLILPFFEGEKDSALIHAHSGHAGEVDFEGRAKEVCLLYPTGKNLRLFLLGLGKKEDSSRMYQAFRSLAFHAHEKWSEEIFIEMTHLPREVALHIARGLALASYAPTLYKTGKEAKKEFGMRKWEVGLIHPSDSLEAELAEGTAIGETQSNMMELVDRPANRKIPVDLANYALRSAQTYGYKAKIYKEEELQKEGLNAVLAVGRGSEHESVMIFLEYKGSGAPASGPQLGLVGKGITFDTGGISIKGSTNMHYMKSDMGGAAAVLGAVELAARLKLPIHLVAAVPSAENSVGTKSIKPGDIIDSYSGKTIEVINTDAEGRLILADGLAWIRDKYAPEVLIDLATLTGDCVRTLGYEAAGLFSNNDQLSAQLSGVGMDIHERLWRFPIWEEYGKDVSSDIADVKNLGSRPITGAIFAAKFLEQFIGDHSCWAHIDMAGVAFGDSEFAKSKTATGYGVHLLLAYMKSLSKAEA